MQTIEAKLKTNGKFISHNDLALLHPSASPEKKNQFHFSVSQLRSHFYLTARLQAAMNVSVMEENIKIQNRTISIR